LGRKLDDNVRPFRAPAGRTRSAADERPAEGPAQRGPAVTVAAEGTLVAPDLKALLAGAAAGDQDALARFYDATSAAVYGLALRILRNPAEAEEVALDVFLQVWRDAARYDAGRGSALSWLLVLTRSRAIDRLRARGPARRVETAFEAAQEPADDAQGPGEASWIAQQGAIVRRALRELPSEQRLALELAYFGGLTHAEIAERLSLPIGTAKTRIRLGLLKLREALAPLLSMENVS
jgi:RNA polymerase sigma-70 factor (ECF subfamily)